MSGPLEGLKIVELAGIGPGPHACMLMADLGADVLRIGHGNPDADDKPIHDALLRSRPSVAIDLKSDAGLELVLELTDQADVFIEGFRPGVTERLGLGPDVVRGRNPRIVYARMTGWGQEGTLSRRAGHDINYVALSGALWAIGRKGERPVPPLNLVGDYGGGSLYLVLGVLAAVFSARHAGEGQVVDVAMVDGAASLMAPMHSYLNMGLWTEERGVNALDSGAHFYEVYETSDHRYVAVGAIEKEFYKELLDGLGLGDEKLPAQMDRSQWPAMKQLFAEIFSEKSRDEWTRIFTDTDACVTPVLSPREAAIHPYNVERDVFSVDGDVQPLPMPRFLSTPGAISSPPGLPGSGTRSGLNRWGIGDDRLDSLRRAGAFGFTDDALHVTDRASHPT